MEMLWYRSWVETRSRFLIGLSVLFCAAVFVVFSWPRASSLLASASGINIQGEAGRKLREALEISRQYRGYVWSQWFSQNFTNLATLFAALLGAGGLLSSRAGGRFLLGLPVSRDRLTLTRWATGVIELFGLVMLPSLVIPILSRAVGETYTLTDALVHGASLFGGACIFYSLAFLLSTEFTDIWRPLLTLLAIAVVIGLAEEAVSQSGAYGIFHMMRAETYFRNGQVPWIGLLASAVASAALLYAATRNIARKDF
jgi:hypothetical protein